MKKNKPVAFVGMATGREAAPFDDPAFEWWTCNGGCLYLEGMPIDICFDMHDWVKSDYYPVYYRTLQQKHDYKVVRPFMDKSVPNCEVFPISEANAYFKHHVFASTMSYIIAYALVKGKHDLYIWGMNTAEFIEYPEMGVSFGYCRGVALEYGLRVHIISPDVPSKAHGYGYRPYSWKETPEIAANHNYVIKGLNDD